MAPAAAVETAPADKARGRSLLGDASASYCGLSDVTSARKRNLNATKECVPEFTAYDELPQYPEYDGNWFGGSENALRADSEAELSEARLGGVNRLFSLMFAGDGCGGCGCGGVVLDGRGYLRDDVVVPPLLLGVDVWKGCGSSKLGRLAAPGRRASSDGCGARWSKAAAPMPGGWAVRAATVAMGSCDRPCWRDGSGQYRPRGRGKPGGSSGAVGAEEAVVDVDVGVGVGVGVDEDEDEDEDVDVDDGDETGMGM